jgi:hypothetical protein
MSIGFTPRLLGVIRRTRKPPTRRLQLSDACCAIILAAAIRAKPEHAFYQSRAWTFWKPADVVLEYVAVTLQGRRLHVVRAAKFNALFEPGEVTRFDVLRQRQRAI